MAKSNFSMTSEEYMKLRAAKDAENPMSQEELKRMQKIIMDAEAASEKSNSFEQKSKQPVKKIDAF